MALHVFVAMPCGSKQDIDFDAVYADCLKPALAGAGFEVFRADMAALADMARAAVESRQGLPTSPVCQWLEDLREPAWRDLLLGGEHEFRAVCETWHRRIELARRNNLPGDVLALAEEAPMRSLRLEACRAAGKTLMKCRQYPLALEQVEAALALDPGDADSQRDKAVLLACLGQADAAREWADSLARRRPRDPDDRCLIGRLEQDGWVQRWRLPGASAQAMASQAAREMPRLARAAEAYVNAFVQDPAHFHSGVNACTLRHLQRHLGGKLEHPSSLANLEGGAIWACLAALERQPDDYRARAGWGELSVLLSPPEQVESAWREAVAIADKDWFALDASRRKLGILGDLGFRPQAVAAARAALDRGIAPLAQPWRPRRVFLFSGHMIDAPDRATPRFPPDREATAARAIAARLDQLGMGGEDLALCGGACGGDILFAEAALERGCRVCLFLQFQEAEFLQASVAFAGETWVERYYALKENPLVRVRVQPEELGPAPRSTDPYERNNRWQLHTALAHGPDKVRCVCLWNGAVGAGPGGTRHMVETVKRHAGQVSILDTRQLFGD